MGSDKGPLTDFWDPRDGPRDPGDRREVPPSSKIPDHYEQNDSFQTTYEKTFRLYSSFPFVRFLHPSHFYRAVLDDSAGERVGQFFAAADTPPAFMRRNYCKFGYNPSQMYGLIPLHATSYVLTLPDWIIPTLVGIAASAIFFWLGIRFRSKSQMAYQLHDFTVIGQPNITNLGDIKILFNSVAVPRVVVTQLAVWNTGNTVVKGKEIVESDPLTICFGDEAVILAAQRVNATQEVNDFRIRVSEHDRSRALLEFDYLNGRDGAKFQIIHTGANGKAKVTGSIRGIPKGVENWGDLQEWSQQKSKLSGLLFPLGFLVLVVILSWVKDLIAPHFPAINKYTEWLGGAVAVLGALLVASLLVLIVAYNLRIRSRATPKPLSRN